ncbi:MAG TPA: hypothetical protein VHU77_07030 [Candidatus Limnocylindria bacterium]|jgi:hypothetical protein|nr:hypothetical protein [Candidatus Limnocylindria bacterium]
MSRSPEPDLHQLFGEWLTLGGGRGRLPRAAAVHAAFCAECRALTAAFDALVAADIARAGFPPARHITAVEAGQPR